MLNNHSPFESTRSTILKTYSRTRPIRTFTQHIIPFSPNVAPQRTVSPFSPQNPSKLCQVVNAGDEDLQVKSFTPRPSPLRNVVNYEFEELESEIASRSIEVQIPEEQEINKDNHSALDNEDPQDFHSILDNDYPLDVENNGKIGKYLFSFCFIYSLIALLLFVISLCTTQH